LYGLVSLSRPRKQRSLADTVVLVRVVKTTVSRFFVHGKPGDPRERGCAGLQAELDAMGDIIGLLPVHAVIIRLFPNYRA